MVHLTVLGVDLARLHNIQSHMVYVNIPSFEHVHDATASNFVEKMSQAQFLQQKLDFVLQKRPYYTEN